VTSVAFEHPTAPSAASLGGDRRARLIAAVLTALAFGWLFAQPARTLVRDWWSNPEAGPGLLLAPLAIWLAWRSGIRRDAAPNIIAGTAMLLVAVLFRYVGGLAAELFTLRASMLLAGGALVVYVWGLRQLFRWWLPVALLVLSVPLPEVVLSAVALPLQFKASQLGAAMLHSRGVPVLLSGNVIRLPGHDLFVTEACSGLRSLTALLSLGLLLGGVALRSPVSRIALLATSIPVAILVNGVRVFLTGFLVIFVDPKLGEGFAHATEGWLLFLISFAALGGLTLLLGLIERRIARRLAPAVAEEVAHA
jgi:exosortase